MQVHSTENIEIVLNGEPRRIPPGLNVLQLLTTLGIDPARVAVELDRGIVRKPEWERTTVGSGALVEVVQFVGGG